MQTLNNLKGLDNKGYVSPLPPLSPAGSNKKGGRSLLFYLSSSDLNQGFFCFGNQSAEGGLVVYGDVSQDLAIDFNRGFFQAIDETAV